MADISISQGNSKHSEDISVLAAGTSIIGRPCTVWTITVTTDTAGDGAVSFSNHAAAFSNTAQVDKVVLTDEIKTFQLVYPKGLYLSAGLTATANKSSMNVSVTYD
jgi:hypothetical protein